MRNVPTLDVPEVATTASIPANSLLSVDPKTVADALNQEFRDAQALAKAWRPDTVLYAHTVEFPPALARGQSKRVYIFGSATAPTDWWTVTVNEQTGERVRATIPKEDYLGSDLPAAPLEFWKITSVQALQIADRQSGKDFRAANPGAEVTATLMRKGPNGWLWWVVTYRGLDNKSLAVRIHPSSGVIYDENGKPVATPSPSSS